MEPTVVSLENLVMNYAWGSTSAIAAFLGRPNPDDLPEAELWIGAHPKAPSRTPDHDDGTLDALIRSAPETTLGRSVAERYAGELPFLLKVIAAAEPLSIQCHPSQEQARAGFDRETRAGIPLSAPERNYRDANHKPELLVALGPFHALCGFRPIPEIVARLRALDPREVAGPLEALAREGSADALKGFVGALLSLDEAARAALVPRAAAAALRAPREDDASAWVVRLQAKHPSDVGVLAPAFLNLITLGAEDAIFLPAGELHAYLEGTGVEIMANSDNVLRGGLTPKHVDVPELLATASFRSHLPAVLRPEAVSAGERVYRTSAPEFELGLIRVTPEAAYASPPGRGVELLLGLGGSATLRANGRAVPVGRGHAAFVPAGVEHYRIEGDGRVCRASVPHATCP